MNQQLQSEFKKKTLQDKNTSKSYRAILDSKKLRQVTSKPLILKSVPSRKVEFELVRFGYGQVIGEIKHVLKQDIFSLESYQQNTRVSQRQKDIINNIREMALTLGSVQEFGEPI